MKKAIFAAVFLIIAIMLANSVLAARGYAYIPNIDPHTRYNPLRNDCYYYYGYGSCNVTRSECSGVSVGQNRWVNLGDACLRNDPPKISQYGDNYLKGNTVYINRLSDIAFNEGQRVVIDIECIDEDPTTITYSGWMSTKEKQSGYDDAGIYDETVTCTDSFGESASGSFKIRIINTNRNPLFRIFDWKIESPKPVFTGNYSE